MPRSDDSTPVSPSFDQLFAMKESFRQPIVNRRIIYLSIQAIINAIIIGVLAKLLVLLIALITNLAFYGEFSLAPASPAGNKLGLAVILIPIAGSILVGIMARYGSKAIRGHGIPEAMEKIITEDSRIPPALTFLKPLSAAISIGTGGPFGAEGPIIATGGAWGSLTGQIMHISSSERKIILTAGACAGMSAIFGSPLAAVLLAIELLLFEFSPRSIIPVALACLTGAGMHLLLFEHGPVFAMPFIPVPAVSALITYVVCGALIGFLATLVSKSVYAVEDLFEKLPVHWMWWPAIGAIAVGITGYFAPHTMGVGYDNISSLLTGKISLAFLLSLCFLKYISWVFSLGSGTSGGTLAPLFTIGGAAGALLGMVILHYFPGTGINLATAALIGMAAMFAGASRAFLTSVVFALETTGQINGLLPLLGACAAAYCLSFFFMKGSIMTEKIQRRGVATPDSYEPDVLQMGTVAQLSLLPDSGSSDLPHVYLKDDIGLAAAIMGHYQQDRLQVLDDKHHKRPVGTINSAVILQYYSDQKSRDQRFSSPARTRKMLVRGRKLYRRMRSAQS